MSPEWIAVWLAGGSLLTSLAVLGIVLSLLRSARAAERSGEERLELLREQQERLKYLHEERRLLKEELDERQRLLQALTRRRLKRPLELEAPQEKPPEVEKVTERHSWWQRLLGG